MKTATTTKKDIIKPYQFAFHDRVPKDAPSFKWFDKLYNGEELTREEKNNVFHMLQGNSGNANYKLSGWIYPFGQFMKTYLVKSKFYGWQEIKAFDKTCIRSSYYTNFHIIEIIEKPTN